MTDADDTNNTLPPPGPQSSLSPPIDETFPSPPTRTSFSPPLDDQDQQRRRSRFGTSKARPMTSSHPYNPNLPPSAPASPPTPAPSPSPQYRLTDWSTADEEEEESIRECRRVFKVASDDQRKRILSELLNMCDNRQLTFVHEFVCPRLKKDPFAVLPNEICLRVCVSLKSKSDPMKQTMLTLLISDPRLCRPPPHPRSLITSISSLARPRER